MLQVVKLTHKERISASALCRVAQDVVDGTLGSGEADLGGGLFKKRVARQGGGKSGGFRMIVAYRRPRMERVLFVYAFAKSAAATLTSSGHEALTRAATGFIGTDEAQLATLLAAGDVKEVVCDGEG